MIIESNSLPTVGSMQKRSSRVVSQRRPRIQGRCSKALVGSGVKRSLDILFNNINNWSKKAAAFFLQRRHRVALFVEHHVAAAALPCEKKVWERHGYRLFMEPAQPTGNGKGTTGSIGVMCEKGLMAGEFLPSELGQFVGETMMHEGRFWQGFTLLLVALYLHSNLGPFGENTRRFAVLGDWNCEPADLLPTGRLTRTSGMVLTPKELWALVWQVAYACSVSPSTVLQPQRSSRWKWSQVFSTRTWA